MESRRRGGCSCAVIGDFNTLNTRFTCDGDVFFTKDSTKSRHRPDCTKSLVRTDTRIDALSMAGAVAVSNSDLITTVGFVPNTWNNMSSKNFLNWVTQPCSLFLEVSLSTSANVISTSISAAMVSGLNYFFILFSNIIYKALCQVVVTRQNKVEV